MPTTVEKFFEEKRKGMEHHQYRTDARGRAECHEKRLVGGKEAIKNAPLDASSSPSMSLSGESQSQGRVTPCGAHGVRFEGTVTVDCCDRAHEFVPLTVYASLGPNKDMRRRRGTALRHGALLTRSGSCARGSPSYPSRVHLAGGEGLRARVRLGPTRGLQ